MTETQAGESGHEDVAAAPPAPATAPVSEPPDLEPLPAPVTPAADSQTLVTAVHEPVAVCQPGRVRSPAGGWLLALVTLGIYYLFWYYNVNKELRDFDRSIRVSPGVAVLALFVPIVNLVSIYNTGGRIRQAQTIAGATPASSGLVGVLLAFVIGLDLPYYNAHANHAWRAFAAR